MLAPTAYLLNSWSIYEAIPVYSAVFVGVSACLALMGRKRNAFLSRGPLIAGAALSCMAGILFIWLSSGIGRTVLYGLQIVVFTALLFSWGRNLCSYSTRKIIAFVATAMLFACLVYFAGIGVGNVFGLTKNVGSVTTGTIFILSFFPLFSAFLFRDEASAPVGIEAEVHREKLSDPFSDPSSNSFSGKALQQVPWTQVGTLFIGAFITALFSGLTFSPYLDKWDVSSGYHFVFLALISLVLLFWVVNKPGTMVLNDIRFFFIFSLIVTVYGLMLFAINTAGRNALTIAVILVAYDCFFMLSLIIFCTLIREIPLRFPPAFAVAMIGTGVIYAPNLGLLFKKFFGYDFSIITPFSIICISLLAVIYLVQNSWHFFLLEKGAAKSAAPKENEEPTVEDTVEPPDKSRAGTPIETMVEQRHRETLSRYSLTRREMQVALQVLEGLTDADIAEKLHIKSVTVRYHISNAYHKMGISSKTELIKLVKYKLVK